MRVLTVSLAAVLAFGSGPVLAQQPPPAEKPKPVDAAGKDRAAPEKPSLTLEERLARARKENPDIPVGEAKVREAEAELNRTRLQVVQKAVALHHALEAQKALVEAAELDFKRLSDLAGKNVAGQGDVDAAKQKLLAAKGRLAEIEAEMPYLSGKLPEHADRVRSLAFSPDGKLIADESLDGRVRVWDARTGKEVPNGAELVWGLAVKQPPQGTMA